ncbi:MAG TPA: DNA methyltransferase [Thermomicrobiales bacterium]|nr:DNA methyltransferase [Thermomicrobiales bacterium]
MGGPYTQLSLPASWITAEQPEPFRARALEQRAFPFEHLSEIAEQESWRKEINRPIYHVHKWWAQRLGSVFRAILIGALSTDAPRVMQDFYEPLRFPGVVVFDPFMGSGTTIGEALKLGARAIGRDINPVAYFAVRNALGAHSRKKILATFDAIERDVGPALRRLYRTRLAGDVEAEVLYYFWVKTVPCPACARRVDLFSSYIFARHAYPRRNPDARAVCPSCGAMLTVRYDAGLTTCTACSTRFDARDGPARGAQAVCPACARAFPIAPAIRERGAPPDHRLYAKLVLLADGAKQYFRTDDGDEACYAAAARELAQRADAYPVAPIQPGHNTDQVLNYGYRYWHELFNQRQLLGLGLLAERIKAIPELALRDLFACLFSGMLEFNNMFASYKGEGTGAVRHMFSHHILKPERTPLEANLWGTAKSSGAFSTLFRRRLLRALDYRADPFEIRPAGGAGTRAGKKVFGLSAPIGHPIAETFAGFRDGGGLYLSCGDSSQTDLPVGSVDLVVTDPPFFDNVHYSELADFFHVWQRHILGLGGARQASSTRSMNEVQSTDPVVFADRLCGVFAECHRVLQPGGLLVFTYHHSRREGWRALLEAVTGAGFVITATQPIKAEMSGAAPKQQAHQPIDLDVIVVCRRTGEYPAASETLADAMGGGFREATAQVGRFAARGRRLSRNDVRVIVMAQVARALSQHVAPAMAPVTLAAWEARIDATIEDIYRGQDEYGLVVREGGGDA